MAKSKKHYWLDSTKLLFAAIAAAIALLLFQFFLDRGLSLSPGWQYFVSGVAVYITGVVVLVYRRHLRRNCIGNLRLLAMAVSWLALPIFGAFLVFYLRVLDRPETLDPYWMSNAILVPIVAAVFLRTLDRKPLRKTSKPFHGSD